MNVNCRSRFNLESPFKTGQKNSRFDMDCSEASNLFKTLDKSNVKVTNHEVDLSALFYRKKLKLSDPTDLSATAEKLDLIVKSENNLNSFKYITRTTTY